MRPPPREPVEHRSRDQADRGRPRGAARDADVERLHLAGVGLARVDPQARLARVEGDRQRCPHGQRRGRRRWRRPRRWARPRSRPAPPAGRSRRSPPRSRRGARPESRCRAARRLRPQRPRTLRARRASGARRLPLLDQGLPSVQRRRARADARGWPARPPRTPAAAPRTRPAPRGRPRAAGARPPGRRRRCCPCRTPPSRDRPAQSRSTRPRHAGPRALHQVEAGDAPLLDRPAVDAAHRLGVGQRRSQAGRVSTTAMLDGPPPRCGASHLAHGAAEDYSTVTVLARLRG